MRRRSFLKGVALALAAPKALLEQVAELAPAGGSSAAIYPGFVFGLDPHPLWVSAPYLRDYLISEETWDAYYKLMGFDRPDVSAPRYVFDSSSQRYERCV